MNILFSTTRQWNPGDEFIHRGVINLLRRAGLRFNSIAWNRHPSIRPGNSRLDNSFDEVRHDPRSLDYAIFAGTPEWRGPRLFPAYRMIAEHGLRCAFLGIGGHGTPISLNDLERSVLGEQTDLIACRDRHTWRELSSQLPGTPTHLLPCPAIFSATNTRVRQGLSRVGVIYQTTHTIWQKTSEETRDNMIELVRRLSGHVEVVVMSNYIDELDESTRLFGSDRVWYSHDSRDFEGAFLDLDCVIAARVHGCLGAISTGAPAILLDWEGDMRRRGLADEVPVLIKGPTHDPAALAETILGLDIAGRSAEILAWREQQAERYLPLLRDLPIVKDAAAPRPPDGGPEPARIRSILAANEEKFRRIDAPRRVGRLRKLARKIKASLNNLF